MKPVMQIYPEYGSRKKEFVWQVLAVKPFDKPGESAVLAEGKAWTADKALSDANKAFLAALN
jgi:hypothetical protein